MGTGLISISAVVRSAVASGYCSFLNCDSLRLSRTMRTVLSEKHEIKSGGQQGGHTVTSDIHLLRKERQ